MAVETPTIDTANDNQERKDRRGLIALAAVLGILLSGTLVLTASRAAFSSQTQNSGNSFAAGDVTLSDDDSDGAMFTITNMAPTDSAVTACIAVTYEGTIADPGEVRLYSGGFTDSGTLASELDVSVEIGTGGSFADCSGFTPSAVIFATDTLNSFDTSHSDYTSGISAWDPSSTPESRTFRFTVDLPTNASNSVQGDSVTDLVFVWEVQS